MNDENGNHLINFNHIKIVPFTFILSILNNGRNNYGKPNRSFHEIISRIILSL